MGEFLELSVDSHTLFSLGRFIKRGRVSLVTQIIFCDQQGQCHCGSEAKWQSCIFPSGYFWVDHKQFVDTSLQKRVSGRRDCCKEKFKLLPTWMKSSEVVWGLFRLIASDWPVNKDRCQGRFCWLVVAG